MLLHDGTHMIDAINFLVDGATVFSRRHGRLRSRKGSTFLHGRCRNVPICLEIGSQRDHLVFEIELSFEAGRIRIGNGVEQWQVSRESPYYEGYRSLLADEDSGNEETGYFATMIEDAVACVDDANRVPGSSALDALEVMKLIKRFRL